MSMQPVIEQLKINNKSEASRENRQTQMLNDLKVQNQEGFQNLINTLAGIFICFLIIAYKSPNHSIIMKAIVNYPTYNFF